MPLRHAECERIILRTVLSLHRPMLHYIVRRATCSLHYTRLIIVIQL